jgi:hypothetical protein
VVEDEGKFGGQRSTSLMFSSHGPHPWFTLVSIHISSYDRGLPAPLTLTPVSLLRFIFIPHTYLHQTHAHLLVQLSFLQKCKHCNYKDFVLLIGIKS